MKESKRCEIYYFSDMQRCMTCGQCWDANDPCPPKCPMGEPKPTGEPKPMGLIGRVIARIFGDLQK